jgi:hypothetical protein
MAPRDMDYSLLLQFEGKQYEPFIILIAFLFSLELFTALNIQVFFADIFDKLFLLVFFLACLVD